LALPEPDRTQRRSHRRVPGRSDSLGAPVQPGCEPPRRHCGTGIGPNRDITGGRRDVDGPCASLPAVSPGRARAHRGNCRLFDTGRKNLVRDRLFAGGNRIRTIGPAEKETDVERGPAADHRRLAGRPVLNDPIQLIGPASLVGNSRETFHKSGTDGSNPVPFSKQSASRQTSSSTCSISDVRSRPALRR
jgi:hypothetical protein